VRASALGAGAGLALGGAWSDRGGTLLDEAPGVGAATDELEL
jgi:hypothetical protein